MKLRRPESPVHEHGRRGRPRKRAPAPVTRPPSRGIQLRLFQAHRDFRRFDERRHANPGNPWLMWGHYLTYRRAEARGWPRNLRLEVQRGLVIVLSGHAEGDMVLYSELVPAFRALGISTARAAEVLDEMGILVDDRRPSFETWLEGKLAGLAPGMRREVERWQQTLHDGGPRTRPRSAGRCGTT